MKALVPGKLIALLVGLTGGPLLHAQSVLQFSAATYNVTEGTPEVAIPVQRTNDLDTVVSVDFATITNGAAVAGVDYLEVSTNITFLAGETNKSVAVPILNDGLMESVETFQVILTNATGGAVLGARSSAMVRIADNDKGLTLEFANYWAREDEGSVLLGVVRGDDGDFPVTVEFGTADSTARAGQDYGATNGVLTFAAGEKLKLLTVPILNDGVRESNETFRIYLTNATGVVLGSPRTATITIIDNDPGIQFTMNQLWVHEDEGAIRLTVSRGSDGLLNAFTVDCATTNMTAIAGQDYAETHGTLEFAAGEMTKAFTVPVVNDGIAERDEQFKVVLSNPSGGMGLGTANLIIATVTICDLTEMLPHRFDNLQVSPEGVVSLTLGGGYTPGVGLVNRFKPDFDIYPVEVSTNLVDWVTLKWLVRTNDSTNVLTFEDLDARGSAQRFYGTPARNFVAPQRAPTGPYAIGFADRAITDDNRRNRYRISTNGSFPITIWYPAERVAGQWPGIYEREPVARDVRDGAYPGYVDRGSYWRGYSVSNAPPAKGLSQLPVVLWSHGWTDVRNDGEELAEHLASQGYIVVDIDHFDSSMVVYPDNTYLYTAPSDVLGREQNAQLLQDRLCDFDVVLRTLSQWNENDELFAGRMNLQNVAVVGFSFGGVAAGEFCRLDQRCVAAVALDPGGFDAAPILSTQGLQKPSLTLHNPAWTDDFLYSKATANAYWFQLRNTEHRSFCTWYWTVTSTSLANSRESARTITDWTLSFLNKYLKGRNDPMPRTADYPQIYNFKQK